MIRLVVDASVLIGELLRATGRERLGDDRLDLFLPEQIWSEVQHEMPRRVAAFGQARGIPTKDADQLTARCLNAVQANVAVIEHAVYSPLEGEARARSVRDPNDWPLVASAIVLSAGIWTNDNDLLGTGIATWTTPSLSLWLERNPD